jgi:hypothetical protein
MNKIFVVLAALAMINVHVARGDGCKATVDGKEVTLQNGDRYCADDTTSKTCNDNGQFTEDKCPPGSKCLKSPNSYATLCRMVVHNANEDPHAHDKDNQGQASAPQSQPQDQTPQAQSPKQDQDAASAGAPQSVDTCTSDRGTLNNGDRYCKSDSTYTVCSNGQLIDDQCPSGSTCKENKTLKQVLCREIRKNAASPSGPNDNSAPKRLKRAVDSNQNQQSNQALKAPTATTPCSTPRGDYMPGQKFCQDDTYYITCNYGETIVDRCPSGSKCLENKEQKQVLCRQYVTNPPQNPQQQQRFKRAVDNNQNQQPNPAPKGPSPTTPCSTPRGDFMPGQRYCKDDSTYTVCNYGESIDGQCPSGSKCLENKEQKQVLCRQYVTNPPQPNPPPQQRFKRAVDSAQNQQPNPAPKGPSPTTPCSTPRGDFMPGQKFCQDDTYYTTCNYGETIVGQCPSGSKCMENKEQKQVLCRQFVTNPPQQQQQQQQRLAKRDANHSKDKSAPKEDKKPDQGAPTPASATGTEAPETCTSDKGTFNTGERYCKSETTHTVCNYGQWIDGECEPGSKCLEKNRQVLCRKIIKVSYPTGPPAGSESQNPEPKPASLPQPSPQAQPQPQPQPQPSPAQGTPESNPHPHPQPQPQPSPAQGTQAPNAQPAPKGTEAPIPAIPAQEPRDCEGGLKEGDKVCSGDDGYKICHDGSFIEDKCPANSKCLASKEGKQVLCREIIRNPNTQQKPQESRRR